MTRNIEFYHYWRNLPTFGTAAHVPWLLAFLTDGSEESIRALGQDSQDSIVSRSILLVALRIVLALGICTFAYNRVTKDAISKAFTIKLQTISFAALAWLVCFAICCEEFAIRFEWIRGSLIAAL